MAELTNLESKIGEVTGLAMAAQVATKTVLKLAQSDASDLVPDLERMRDDAAETERRCTELLSTFEGKKTAILDEARATKSKGADMLKIYLDDDSDALAVFVEAFSVVLLRFGAERRRPVGTPETLAHG